MEDADGGELTAQTAYVATVLVRADPEQIRDAFDIMLNALLEQQSKDQSIVDWGTLECMSIGAVDPDTGGEYIDLGLGVRAINVPKS